ncbi:hypothetical protein SAMN05421759_12711 [Roseivivax lentus]|uniref:SbsA Ig-like domain-containing protein n=1 Tax=Roseivivax lentus TaxID=633194 RepID=A0A1N7Q424_9RHOB|nr:hypothetical protein [Roseivivax lentus]SIT17622.1 hypothetical protein SAMN05421759_12711 [Roseivivax lentus]
MSALGHLVWRALLAALCLLPLAVHAEVMADVDDASGAVVISGLEAGEVAAMLADPEIVSLRVSGIASERGTPVTLAKKNGALVVAPRFTLMPGMNYVVALGNKSYPVSLPEPIAPAPMVVAFAPSQSTIPANTLRLYLRFSQPMARGQLRGAVMLSDAGGRLVDRPFLSLETELWDPSQTRATLLLDPGRIKQGVGPNLTGGAPLQAGQSYRLTVTADMESAAGVPLGEVVTIAFRAGPSERRAVDPTDWHIVPPLAGSQVPLTIVFDRIMDSGAARHLIELMGPDGRPIRGMVRTDGGGWSLTPTRPWTEGLHHLVLAPDLEDVSGNSVGSAFDAEPGTIGASERPVILPLGIGN